MDESTASDSAWTTRQKSCNACVKAKRGCDKRHPVCSRCEEKNQVCVYAKRPHSEAFSSEVDLDPTRLDLSWTNLDSSLVDFFDIDTAGPNSMSSSSALDMPRESSSNTPHFAFQCLSQIPEVSPRSIQRVSRTTDPDDHSENEARALTKANFARMADICVRDALPCFTIEVGLTSCRSTIDHGMFMTLPHELISLYKPSEAIPSPSPRQVIPLGCIDISIEIKWNRPYGHA
jgi:hypothetical protein